VRRFRVMPWKVVVASLLLVQTHAWAAESPMEGIRIAVDKAVAVLQSPGYQEPEHRQQRMEKIKEIVLPLFDSQEIAKRALGIHWRDRTEEQRKEFVRLFIALVESTYSGTLDRYRKDVQVFFDQEHIDGNFAEVNTRILDPSQQKTFAINYQLHQVGEKWLIYDVVIENVSMVRNYRNQFNRILSKSSYEDLIDSIERKIKELASAPS
jgi:phospholipid transport system substrate-binding protein